ncbi:MAG TPA: peptidase, partial [Flavobacteriaceae bacterium]|nr:peptidase [Flavobacteriaceae bacterium]
MIKKIIVTSLIVLGSSTLLFAQDKLKKMPGYERYIEIAPKIRGSVKGGSLSVTWNKTGNSFEYNNDGKRVKYDVKSGKTTEIGAAVQPDWSHYYNRPQRGRQYASADSPDGKLKAFTKDRNMYISDNTGNNTITITNEGNTENQIKYGIATWVYGEELDQITAMWWSPDSKKIAFYKFNEKGSKKYYVLYDQTKIQNSVEIEAYPKVGAKNLPVDILVYDLETQQTITLDTRNGKPYHDGDLGTYLYDIAWSPDGKELLFHSTNRKQNIMEFKAADPNTGKTRVIVREEWLPSFTVNSPEIHILKDGKRFIWASERSGYKNYYLYDFSGELIKP